MKGDLPLTSVDQYMRWAQVGKEKLIGRIDVRGENALELR
jgi:hypothetical protein